MNKESIKSGYEAVKDFVSAVILNRQEILTFATGKIWERTFLKPAGLRLLHDIDQNYSEDRRDEAMIFLISGLDKNRKKTVEFIEEQKPFRSHLENFSQLVSLVEESE